MRSPWWSALIVMVSLTGPAGADPVSSKSFDSCEALRAEVEKAGKDGLLIDRETDRVYVEKQCYRDYIPETITVFDRYVEINGKRCNAGYMCLQSGGAG